MVRKDINTNLRKQIAKNLPDITGAELEKVAEIVKMEALRAKKKSVKSAKRKKPDCGCDA